MKKITFTVLLAAMLLMGAAGPVLAANHQQPQAACPPGFELHMFDHHMADGHHDHHIGLKVDLNGDGSICVKHLGNGLHVHVDNVVR